MTHPCGSARGPLAALREGQTERLRVAAAYRQSMGDPVDVLTTLLPLPQAEITPAMTTSRLRLYALAALICGSVLLLAGLLALALVLVQMCAEAQEGGLSTRCVLGACLVIGPDTVLLSWPP